MSRSRRTVRTALTIALLAAIPKIAAAEGEGAAALPVRKALFSWDATSLRMSVSFRDVVTPPLLRKLSSGLPTVILLRAYLFESDAKTPVGLAVRSCRVVYDLWDEVYRIKVGTQGGERDLAVVNAEGVLRQCGETVDMPLASRSLFQANHAYFVALVIEVNPVSAQMLEQMRRWIARPLGSTGLAPSDAIFSSVVSMFVRQIGTSDNTLTFRTETTSPPSL